jgi:hypothetical protein
MDDLLGTAADFEGMEAVARSSGRHELEVRAMMRWSAVLFRTDQDCSAATAGSAVQLCQELQDPELMAQSQGPLSPFVGLEK